MCIKRIDDASFFDAPGRIFLGMRFDLVEPIVPADPFNSLSFFRVGTGCLIRVAG